jgi:DNA-binding GntR family transcriptional regulator
MSNTASWDVIARDLTDQIASGVLAAGDRLPSEAELARR